MHCVAGDGLGILAGAVISNVVGIAGLAEVVVEYVLGFGFGWTIFQALFMRDSAGGSYRAALANTFVPELLSMNFLMAGMVPTVMTLRTVIKSANDPATPHFWFVMSMGLLVGFIIAYPNELVAGRQSSQARHDDGAPDRSAGRDGGSRRAYRQGRHDGR